MKAESRRKDMTKTGAEQKEELDRFWIKEKGKQDRQKTKRNEAKEKRIFFIKCPENAVFCVLFPHFCFYVFLFSNFLRCISSSACLFIMMNTLTNSLSLPFKVSCSHWYSTLLQEWKSCFMSFSPLDSLYSDAYSNLPLSFLSFSREMYLFCVGLWNLNVSWKKWTFDMTFSVYLTILGKRTRPWISLGKVENACR